MSLTETGRQGLAVTYTHTNTHTHTHTHPHTYTHTHTHTHKHTHTHTHMRARTSAHSRTPFLLVRSTSFPTRCRKMLERRRMRGRSKTATAGPVLQSNARGRGMLKLRFIVPEPQALNSKQKVKGCVWRERERERDVHTEAAGRGSSPDKASCYGGCCVVSTL